jgi:hypothetical protein
MSEIFIPGPVSGKNYSFRIAGDQPTADERQRIDAILRQQETEFAGQYQARFGQDLLPSRGVGAQFGEFFRGIPRGAGGLFETAALGLATPFGEETEDRLREGIRSIGMNLQDRYAAPIGREETVGGRLGEAVGSMGAIAGAGLGAGLLGGPIAGFGVGAGLGAAAGAGEASERARSGDATLEERNLATRLGLIPGALEVVPLVRLSRTLERGGLRERLTRALMTAGEEGLQEAASSVAQNLIEQNVYNPERGTFTDTGEDLGYGAGAGALVQAISDLFIPGRLRGRVGEGTPIEQAVPAEVAPPPPVPSISTIDPAALQTQPDLPLPASVEPLRPGFVEGDVQGSLLAPRAEISTIPEAAPVDAAPVAETQVAPEAPAAETAAPTARQPNADLVKLLQDLEIPRTARVSQLVRNGTVNDMAGFREALSRFAAATTPERKARATQWLQTSREQPTPDPAAETDVRNTTLEPEAQAEVETTQEVQDAQTAPSGPVEPDPTPDRTGIEGGIAELDTGEVAIGADPAGAEPSVGGAVGQPVLGPREPDAPTGEQPATLTEPTVDLTEGDAVAVQNWFAENYPGRSIDDFAPSEAERSAAQTLRQAQAEYDQQFTLRPNEAGPPHRRMSSAQWGSYDLMAAERSSNPEETAAAAKIRSAEIALQRSRARRLDDTAFMRSELREILSDKDPALLDDPFPVLQAALSDTRVPRIEEVFRPQQTLAPEAATADQGASLARDALPGQVTGAGPQVIPPPVAPAPRFTSEGAAIDPLVAEAAAAQEAQDKVAAQDAIDAWYETNASLQLKAGRARIAGTAIEPSVMPAADMEAVVALLRKAPKQGKGGRITPERAAFVYFSKSPDTNFVLESIAYDQAQKMSTDYKSREADFRRDTEFETPDEAAFYKGTGAEVAMRAARWIRDNLSEGTRRQVADYTFNKYRPIDYEAASERRDVRRAQARNQQAEVDQIIRDTYGDTTPDADTAADLGFAAEDLRGYDLSSFAGRTEWPSSVHPRVAQLIAAGDIRGALQGLAVTSPNANLRTLAGRLVARVQDTPTQIVPAETMNRIRATMSPETPTLGVETPAGVYVHPMSPDALAAMRREGHEDAAGIVEEFGGQILFNENTPLAPELVMHEAVHAVGDQVLTNKSHPLTRQLDKLRTELLKFMPATNYGLSNVREFFAEGMTNPAFRQQLSYATTEGKPYSAWDNFKNIVRNWMRGLMGRQPIKPDTALTSLDRALDAVLAMNPNEMGAGSVVGASFAPGGAQQVIRDAFERTRVPNSGDLQRMRNLLQNSRVPASWKGALMRLAMPLDYVGDAASKYLPSARRIHDLVMQQQAAIQKGSTMVMQTTEATAKVLGKYRRDQSVIDNFNRVLFEASRLQIDPRKSRSDYEGYSFQYNVLDADGNIVRRVESKKFANEADRNQAIRDYNNKLTQEQRRNPVARAKRLFDETPEGLQDYDRLRGIYQSLPAEVKSEANRMFALQPAVGKELVDAIRARLEALLPQQRALQDKVFGMIYDKMLSGQLLDPYVALRRQGEFWLSYSAVDPNSVTIDPATGQPDYSNAQIEQFKHSFQTQAQRDEAIARTAAAST